MGKLTNKQEKYVKLIISGLSQRQAYIKVYPHAKKWKANTIDNRASKLFNKDEVITRYRELLKEADKEAKITHNMLREELAKMAFFDIGEILNEDGTLKQITEMSETARKVISSVKIRQEKIEGNAIAEVTEVKLNDKLQSIEKLAKHIGFYLADNTENNTAPTINLNITTKRKNERN